MKDCVINNAGKDDINMVIGLFLASRQITSNGGERNILAANVWDRKGRKKTDKLIYGVIDLKLSLLYKDINQIYHAEYEKWIPELVKNSNTFKFYTSKGYYIKEKVFLKKNNNNWLIYKFEKLEQVSVEKKRVSE